MKTLNDYIRESILDDEDVLISKSIEDSQNSFYIIKSLLNECNYNLKQARNKQEYIERILKPIKDQFMKYSKIKKNGLGFDIDNPFMNNYACSLIFYTFHGGERMPLFEFVYELHSKDEMSCYINTIANESGYSTILNGVSKFLMDKYNFKQKYLKHILVLEL